MTFALQQRSSIQNRAENGQVSDGEKMKEGNDERGVKIVSVPGMYEVGYGE